MMYSEYPAESSGTLLRRVFGWMTLGLALTGLTAWTVSLVPQVRYIIANKPLVVFLLFLLQLGLVMYLSMGLSRMSKETAITTYVLYSLVTGLTLSTLILFFTFASLATTFFVCAGMFGAMTMYALITKSDLSGLGSFLLMAVVGLIIAGLINFFLRSPSLDFALSVFGVIVFTLFTAYDVQMIRRLGMYMLDDGQQMTKVSIICALRLYLDFLNLFLYLLNFFGQKKD